MLAYILFNLLLLHSIWAINEEYSSNGWIPIAKPNVNYQTKRSYNEDKYENTWKPTENIDNYNIDIIKANAIQLIIPQRGEFIYNKQNASVSNIKSIQNPIYKSSNREEDDLSIITPNKSKDILYSQHLPSKPRRESKHLRSSSSVNDNISTASNKTASDIEPSETRISSDKSFKTTKYNNYEVTESTNNHDIIQKTNGEGGYTYQKPLISTGLAVNKNEYTKKFVQLLSKYNIKVHDSLNNYAQSKLHHNNILNFNPYHVPFRYNSLNHRPVDPLLAVLLSNYGYYLQGFYGQPNNYKNLYGYSASNNIHNNKPFGSYKIFSDTDSSN